VSVVALPRDAFEFWITLGDGRSVNAVASYYGVNESTVRKVMERDQWELQLAAMEAESAKRTREHLVDEMVEMNRRHLTGLRDLQARALAALRRFPLSTARDALLAYSFATRVEREIVEAGRAPGGGLLPGSKFKEEHSRWMRAEASTPKTIEATATPVPPPASPPSPESGS
jgi:hypothetical protein